MIINSAFKRLVLENKIKYIIAYGGAGSSKSYSICQKLIIKCVQRSRKVLVLRKTAVSLNDSVVALFHSILSKEGIPYTYNKQERVLRFCGSVVLFKGLDDPERIKSITDITDIWLEECTEFSPDDFTQLVLRLRANVEDLQFLISFNPISKANWVYRFFFDKTSPDYFLRGKPHMIMKSTYKDNAFLPADYIRELESLKISNPVYYDVYCMGDWGVLGKLVFPSGSWSVGSPVIPPHAKYIYGYDQGWVDKAAFACIAVWDDILYIFDEWCGSEVLVKDQYPILKEKSHGRVIYGDCAGAATIAELNALGLYNLRPCVKKPGSVLASIDQMKSYKIIINPKCEELIREMGIYSWKKDPKTGLYLDEPDEGSGETHPNVIPACRYAMQALGVSVKTVNIKLHKGL